MDKFIEMIEKYAHYALLLPAFISGNQLVFTLFQDFLTDSLTPDIVAHMMIGASGTQLAILVIVMAVLKTRQK